MSDARPHRIRCDAIQLRTFQARLLRWFRQNGRDLPWRKTRDPYKILVSEVMLQQTQVDRVRGYYARFLREYPTIRDLAAAHPARVRESWEGLGYYARARNLHATARAVTEQHDGRFPRRLDEVMALPGVGRYTAGAVVSFAYGDPAPALDTNVRRVLTRVFVRRAAKSAAKLDRRMWALAATVIPPKQVWAFNQAIMDFGATVCTARNPKCGICPMRSICVFAERMRRSHTKSAEGKP
jgi:A/G-specific adenine glycosylase